MKTRDEIYTKYQSRIDKIVENYYKGIGSDDEVTDNTRYKIVGTCRWRVLSNNHETIADAIVSAIYNILDNNFPQSKNCQLLIDVAKWILDSLENSLIQPDVSNYWLAIQIDN